MHQEQRLTVEVIEELGRRATGTPIEGLGHPVAVRSKLGTFMDEATSASEIRGPGRTARVVAKVAEVMIGQQRTFNRAVLGALHQFDHRTTTHDETIRHLEARIDALERDTADDLSAAE